MGFELDGTKSCTTRQDLRVIKQHRYAFQTSLGASPAIIQLSTAFVGYTDGQ